MRNAWFLASRGTREYKNKVMVKGSRDTKGLQVMQIVMGDEHTFDCWVSYKQPNGKVIAIKPHLAAWVDMRSRVIMGDVMCKDANSDILKQSLLKMIYSEPGGVPEYLYIDNGKDYTAKTMTGRDRNDRSGMNFDNETSSTCVIFLSMSLFLTFRPKGVSLVCFVAICSPHITACIPSYRNHSGHRCILFL